MERRSSSVLKSLSGSIAVMHQNVWLSYVEQCERKPKFPVVQLLRVSEHFVLG